MEKDTLDMIWNGLDFVKLLELNKKKYLEEYGIIPKKYFQLLINTLTDLSKEFFQLLDEIDAHKESTILNLKKEIDARTKIIVEKAKEDPNFTQSNIKHNININEEDDLS